MNTWMISQHGKLAMMIYYYYRCTDRQRQTDSQPASQLASQPISQPARQECIYGVHTYACTCTCSCTLHPDTCMDMPVGLQIHSQELMWWNQAWELNPVHMGCELEHDQTKFQQAMLNCHWISDIGNVSITFGHGSNVMDINKKHLPSGKCSHTIENHRF